MVAKQFEVEVKVQKSKVRIFQAEEYLQYGIEIVDDISGSDVLLGVKEVPEGKIKSPSEKLISFSLTL